MGSEQYGIVPYGGTVDITTSRDFTKLKLGETQQMQVSALLSQLPALTAAGGLADVYTVSFPRGVAGSLMRYADGGLGTPIIGENGKIAGHASLQSLAGHSAALGCFTAMSIASSQYFLKRIDGELKMMRSKLDDILSFLYGEKKAELLAEVSFVRYAYENYAAIMECDSQRSGVIAGLIDARKIAMKDIEFYLSDLDSAIRVKENRDLESTVANAFQIKDSLIFSMQLYGMSSLLEVYYAQNFDKSYLTYVENDISVFIDKCEKRMLSNFSSLRGTLDNAKGPLLKKTDYSTELKKIDEFVETLSQGEETDIRKSLRSAINAAAKAPEYYMTKSGEVYLKTA